MYSRSRSSLSTLQAVVIVAFIVVAAAGGLWWYTSSHPPSQGISPSLTSSPAPTYTYDRYSRFGFSFEHPEGMVFTAGVLTGGFDHAHPVSGDVQGVLSETPESAGVIWLPAESAPSLEAVLDELFASVEVGGAIRVQARGPFTTGMKDDLEMVYQAFNITVSEEESQTGIIGTWHDDEQDRVYAFYVVTVPEVAAQRDLHVSFERYVDSFDSYGLDAPSETLEPYWPTEAWRVARPEDVGMDPEKLDEMIQAVKERGIGVDNILVIRNGYVIMDAYFPPFDEGRLHVIFSCTKSVVSTLIAISLEEGYIESLDQRLLDLFPDRTVENLNGWKEEITLRDLLTMTAGFDARDSYLYEWEGLTKMYESPDAVQYVLDLPVIKEPGTGFEYTNGVSHLLSAIVTETSGMSASEFAEEHLFTPLGISDFTWENDSLGRNWGWSGLYLTPHDMAKIGYLFLNEGVWDGEQIVSGEWVEEATVKHVDATIMPGYGYQ